MTGLESAYQINQVIAAEPEIGGAYSRGGRMLVILAVFDIRLTHDRDSSSPPHFVICY